MHIFTKELCMCYKYHCDITRPGSCRVCDYWDWNTPSATPPAHTHTHSGRQTEADIFESAKRSQIPGHMLNSLGRPEIRNRFLQGSCKGGRVEEGTFEVPSHKHWQCWSRKWQTKCELGQIRPDLWPEQTNKLKLLLILVRYTLQIFLSDARFQSEYAKYLNVAR